MYGAKDYTTPLGSITHGRLQFTRGAADRYDLEVTGGASKLSIGTR